VRERRLVFGEVADVYDRVRPSYPAALIDRIVALSGIEADDVAVEVGAGTGKATELVAARGVRIDAIEPSPEMAAELRTRVARFGDQVRVHEASFETWEPPPGLEHAALVYAAQSWHWVEPGSRVELAAAALRAGGWLALWWNRPAPRDDQLRRDLDAAYERVAPVLVEAGSHNRVPGPGSGSTTPPGETSRRAEAADELGTDRRFELIVTEEFPWRRWYPTTDYLALLTTYSDHRMLDPDVLDRLLDEVAAVLDSHGGGIDHGYETLLVAARRAG
jgi:SAM-dependent methyltransferase